MNSSTFALQKLEVLLKSIPDDPTKLTQIESASLWGAVRWLLRDLSAAGLTPPALANENLIRASDALGALLGFEPAGGHPPESHRAWATSAQQALMRL